jgi:hypothetical protein
MVTTKDSVCNRYKFEFRFAAEPHCGRLLYYPGSIVTFGKTEESARIDAEAMAKQYQLDGFEIVGVSSRPLHPDEFLGMAEQIVIDWNSPLERAA